MVTFTDGLPPATDADLAELERRLGFLLPRGIRHLLKTANGGAPRPDALDCSTTNTDVHATLPLHDRPGGFWWTYDLLILKKGAAPRHFLPFALDSGGNSFLIDSKTEEVHFLTHDGGFQLWPLGMNLATFWESLTEDVGDSQADDTDGRARLAPPA